MPQTLSIRDSVVQPVLDDINPIKTGETIMVWAAGATVSTIEIMAGMKRVLGGEYNVEAAADVVDVERDFLCKWTNMGGDVNIAMTLGAATAGFILMVVGPQRG